jgi:hypothetical protein
MRVLFDGKGQAGRWRRVNSTSGPALSRKALGPISATCDTCRLSVRPRAVTPREPSTCSLLRRSSHDSAVAPEGVSPQPAPLAGVLDPRSPRAGQLPAFLDEASSPQSAGDPVRNQTTCDSGPVKRLRFSPTPTAGQRTSRHTCINRPVRDSFLVDDKFADAFERAARPSTARQEHPGWAHLRSRTSREQHRQPWTSVAASAYQRREPSFRNTIAVCRFPSARSCYAGRNPSSWLGARSSTAGPTSSAAMSSRDSSRSSTRPSAAAKAP